MIDFTDTIITYTNAIAHLFMIVGVMIIIYSLDDVVIDIIYWLIVALGLENRAHKPVKEAELLAKLARPIAIMVPAWHESDVIYSMLKTNIELSVYPSFVFFVGAYQNDPETQVEISKAMKEHPDRVQMVVNPRNGPTTKADCLNAVIAGIKDYERKNDIEFVGIALHDSEDVIHPLEFALFNYFIDHNDFIQLPIFSFSRQLHHFVAGIYMDEFAEVHTKDLVVRELLTGIVPCAGVSACFSAKAIRALIDADSGEAFDTSSLTEDYDVAFRIKKLGLTAAFIRNDADFVVESASNSTDLVRIDKTLPIATRENFPDNFRAAYRQRARWILGIVFQGAENLGWGETTIERLFFIRDRKGVLSGIIAMVGYFLTFNVVIIAGLSTLYDNWRIAAYVLLDPFLQSIFAINMGLLLNRLFQRTICTIRIYGIAQGLMAGPRTAVSNFVNFCAALRALFMFIWRHKVGGNRLSWDKTAHSIPIGRASPVEAAPSFRDSDQKVVASSQLALKSERLVAVKAAAEFARPSPNREHLVINFGSRLREPVYIGASAAAYRRKAKGAKKSYIVAAGGHAKPVVLRGQQKRRLNNAFFGAKLTGLGRAGGDLRLSDALRLRSEGLRPSPEHNSAPKPFAANAKKGSGRAAANSAPSKRPPYSRPSTRLHGADRTCDI